MLDIYNKSSAIYCNNLYEAYKILDILYYKSGIKFSKFGHVEEYNHLKDNFLGTLPLNCRPIILIVYDNGEYGFYRRCPEENDLYIYNDWHTYNTIYSHQFFNRKEKLERLLK